ncbi:MAG: DUF4062 domain-containing protein [Proteobacteria bacterium]|nr:MAG: DUF4062 domain-containing protein [Pseudomonadota bacterium]
MIASEKKYQVFVSSTYEDLRAERQEVIQALLELDCIPSGMELFPAANEDQWSLIKSVIDECDYYVLILAGRYGTVGKGDLGYTEMEYRYALSIGKPIIAFLHKDPSSLPKKLCEVTADGQKKLEAFRGLVSSKMCRFWSTAAELGSVVSRSLIMLQRSNPAVGWVRGDVTTDKDASIQIVKLNKQIDELNKQLDLARTQAPPGTDRLAQGEDEYTFTYDIDSRSKDGEPWKWENFEASVSWNEIFFALSPLMMHEANEFKLKSTLQAIVLEKAKDTVEAQTTKSKGHTFNWARFAIKDSDFQTVKVQLRSLGLTKLSIRSRSIKDTTAYWTLTPYGEEAMYRLRAIAKSTVDTE